MARLLIVDDEQDIREFAGNFFRKRGIDVHVACSGREALQKIEEARPDLMLLDVRMQDGSGLDVLRELHSRKDPLKVIMVSGMEDEVTITQARDLGAIDFIHKPLVLDELKTIVLCELKSL